MFIKYWENRKPPILKESDTGNAIDLIRQNGVKIKNEIYRKQGVELVFYSVEDAIKARDRLKFFRTSIRDNSVFIYSNPKP